MCNVNFTVSGTTATAATGQTARSRSVASRRCWSINSWTLMITSAAGRSTFSGDTLTIGDARHRDRRRRPAPRTTTTADGIDNPRRRDGGRPGVALFSKSGFRGAAPAEEGRAALLRAGAPIRAGARPASCCRSRRIGRRIPCRPRCGPPVPRPGRSCRRWPTARPRSACRAAIVEVRLEEAAAARDVLQLGLDLAVPRLTAEEEQRHREPQPQAWILPLLRPPHPRAACHKWTGVVSLRASWPLPLRASREVVPASFPSRPIGSALAVRAAQALGRAFRHRARAPDDARRDGRARLGQLRRGPGDRRRLRRSPELRHGAGGPAARGARVPGRDPRRSPTGAAPSRSRRSGARPSCGASPPATWTRWSTATPPTGGCGTTTPTRPAAKADGAPIAPWSSTRSAAGRPSPTSPSCSAASRPACGGSPTTTTGPTRSGGRCSSTPRPTCWSTATASAPSWRSRTAWRPARRPSEIRDLRGTAFSRPTGPAPEGWTEIDSRDVDTPGAPAPRIDPYADTTAGAGVRAGGGRQPASGAGAAGSAGRRRAQDRSRPHRRSPAGRRRGDRRSDPLRARLAPPARRVQPGERARAGPAARRSRRLAEPAAAAACRRRRWTGSTSSPTPAARTRPTATPRSPPTT